MSCGFGSPSAMTSPFSTCSPSNTLRWRHFGINSSYLSVASLVMIKRRLPLVSLPKLTVPLLSARIAESFGLRASNRSATRGKPPVMSRVFEDSCGIRAMTSPTDTFDPSSRLTMAPAGSAYTAGMSVFAKVTSLPLALVSRTTGRRSLPPEPRCLGSSTTVLVRPVTSSTWLVTVMPSTKS